MEQIIYNVILITEYSLIIPVFILLFFIRAPYGKFLKKDCGLKIAAPGAWFLMEVPAFVIPVIFFLYSGKIGNIYYLICMVVWVLHYGQRTFIYPFLLNKNSRKVPLFIILFSVLFNLINGYVNGYGVFIYSKPNPVHLDSALSIIGLSIFGIGIAINIHSDYILRKLRIPGDSSYKIPDRGLFKYVSCPHYFGEILEWCGWFLLTRSPAAAAFLLFTMANLFPRAITTHIWYQQTFPEYPHERKAILPFIL